MANTTVWGAYLSDPLDGWLVICPFALLYPTYKTLN